MRDGRVRKLRALRLREDSVVTTPPTTYAAEVHRLRTMAPWMTKAQTVGILATAWPEKDRNWWCATVRMMEKRGAVSFGEGE